MPVPLLDLAAHHAPLMDRFIEALTEVARSGRFVLGPHVEGFERQLAAYCEAEHAVGVSSGTDALLVALMALGIGQGDEVITSPFTFFATAGSISRVGAVPVFVDIDPVTYNLDVARIADAITPRTKAIMPVHLFGQAADMAPIVDLARERGLKVIEDAAQAIGARDDGRRVGAIGDVGCFSFYPTKNLSAMGDAGACTTNDAALAERLRQLRLHGETSKYHHQYVGGNFRLDAMQAAVLEIKLPHLDDWAEARRRHAGAYCDLIGDLPIVLPAQAKGKHHVYNQFTVRIADGRRDACRAHLKSQGIGHEVYYPVPLHLQVCFASLRHAAGAFPEAERAAREVVSLPVFPELTDTQQQDVAAAVRAFFDE